MSVFDVDTAHVTTCINSGVAPPLRKKTGLISSTRKDMQAQAEVDTYPAFWLRGILPATLFLADPIPLPIAVTTVHLFDPDLLSTGWWPSGTYGTDASGGEFSSFPEIRRCGCGIATMKKVKAAHSSTLSGVPRFPWKETYKQCQEQNCLPLRC